LDVSLKFVPSYIIKNSIHEFRGLIWNKLVDRLVYSKERNQTIVNDVISLVRQGHKCLILTSRVYHCTMLISLLKQAGINAEMFVGDVKKEDRQDIKEDMHLDKVDVIAATYQIAVKGLNIPSLSCLCLPIPIKDKNILQQATGRIRRVHPNKLPPVVRDYVDMAAPILKKKAKGRALSYLELGYIIIENHNDLLSKPK